ncbi:MAG: Fur family transcriptional regulator [Anaerolineaceae bacterium]
MNGQTILSQAGYRLSEPRKCVMQLLESADTPLSPLAIYRMLTSQGYRLGLVSVYRTLELLGSLGLVTIVYQPDGGSGYMNATGGHHHHILCQGCHKAIEFSGSEDLTELIQRVEGETNFQVNGHLLQLYGLCPECQALVSQEQVK